MRRLAHIQHFHDITTASTAETPCWAGLNLGRAAAWTSPVAAMLAHRGRSAHSRASSPHQLTNATAAPGCEVRDDAVHSMEDVRVADWSTSIWRRIGLAAWCKGFTCLTAVCQVLCRRPGSSSMALSPTQCRYGSLVRGRCRSTDLSEPAPEPGSHREVQAVLQSHRSVPEDQSRRRHMSAYRTPCLRSLACVDWLEACWTFRHCDGARCWLELGEVQDSEYDDPAVVDADQAQQQS